MVAKTETAATKRVFLITPLSSENLREEVKEQSPCATRACVCVLNLIYFYLYVKLEFDNVTRRGGICAGREERLGEIRTPIDHRVGLRGEQHALSNFFKN